MSAESSINQRHNCAATYSFPKTSALIFDEIIFYRKSSDKSTDRLLGDNGICRIFINTDSGSSMYEEDMYEDSLFYSLMFGLKITPVFSTYKMLSASMAMMDSQPNHLEWNLKKFQADIGGNFHGKSQAYTLCVDSIPRIDEKSLTWDQVLDIRKDKQAKEQIARFHRWVLRELIGKSQDEVEAILGQSFDDYNSALKKHGILTISGAVTAAITATPGICQLINSGSLDAIVGLGATVSIGLIEFTAAQAISLIQLRRDPIAFAYDVSKKIK